MDGVVGYPPLGTGGGSGPFGQVIREIRSGDQGRRCVGSEMLGGDKGPVDHITTTILQPGLISIRS